MVILKDRKDLIDDKVFKAYCFIGGKPFPYTYDVYKGSISPSADVIFVRIKKYVESEIIKYNGVLLGHKTWYRQQISHGKYMRDRAVYSVYLPCNDIPVSFQSLCSDNLCNNTIITAQPLKGIAYDNSVKIEELIKYTFIKDIADGYIESIKKSGICLSDKGIIFGLDFSLYRDYIEDIKEFVIDYLIQEH